MKSISLSPNQEGIGGGLPSNIRSSDSNKSFINVTAHFIKQTRLKSVVISTSEIQETHTTENIAIAIQKAMDQW